MKKLLATTALIGLAFAAPAYAVPITGEVSINGDDSFTATSITFANPANLGSTSGSFATAFGTAVADNVVTMIGTLTASSTGNLFSISGVPGHLGNVGTLAITPPTTFSETGGPLPDLTVTGKGTLSLTGFDSTAGIWTVTTQGVSTEVTFSATAIAAAPEPASLALLGVGLLGIGFVANRKRS
jgi:hypothetical protein